ncbi:MAG: class I SAM-dependent methyltransferase [Flavobacteriales bacterium]|nr:class I SAM-dependent methyltransferase [Flavobacteriales bacterium]
MDPYKETIQTWDKLAERYEQMFMDMDIYHESYAAFCDALGAEEGRLLEIGCGPGNITQYLQKKVPTLQITATDVSPSMIERVNINVPSAEARVMDARDVGALQESFNAIVCGFIIPYLSAEDCTQMISACGRLIQKGGVCYLSFVPGNPKESGFVTGSTGDRSYFHYHAKDRVMEDLSKAYLEVFKTFEIIYKKANGVTEMHLVVLARRLEG